MIFDRSIRYHLFAVLSAVDKCKFGLVMNRYRLMFIVYLFDPLHKIRKAFCCQAPEGTTEGYFLRNDIVSITSFHERH